VINVDWGKLQTAGYGTALKVLFEFDEKDSSRDPPLRRTELVALLNTMDRLSHSLIAIKEFRRMIDERDGVKSASPVKEAEAVKTKLLLEEEEDDGYPDFTRSNREGLTVMEEFWEELSLVTRAFIYVFKSWLEFPGLLLKIVIVESSRLWDYWLGLPMRPRSWEVRWPRKDEL